jgi:hypothetical protein
MNREVPMQNRICGFKEIKRAWEIHETKLKHLRGSIDTVAPKKYIYEKKNVFHNSISTKRLKEIEQ